MREGYKDTPIGMIPENWDVAKLGSEVELIHGYQFRSDDFVEKGIPVIKIGNVIGSKLDLSELTYIDPNRFNDFKQYEIKDGDILMSLTGNIGRVIEVTNLPYEVVQNYRVGKFESKSHHRLVKRYIKYLLTSNIVLDQLNKFANQSAQANFGKQDMDKIWIALPNSIEEQSKIASILSTIDDKIDAISERITQTQQLKIGLMQRLLTRGIGHTKFKNSLLGEIPESWEIHRLSDIAIINDESLSNDTDPEYSFQYIDLTSVKVGKIDFPSETIQFKNAPSRARRILKNGDVLMATVRPNLLGYSIADFDTTDIVCSTGFAVITPRQKILGQFIYQSLYSESMQCQIQKLLVGSNYPAINSTDVENLKVSLPPYSEQHEISEILCTVDQKLIILQDKKNEYDKLKQGLMQQLLTGKIRVSS